MATSAIEVFKSKLEKEWKWKPKCEVHQTAFTCACRESFFCTVSLRQWMKGTERNQSKTNIERLLEEAKPIKPYFSDPKEIFEGQKPCILVFGILLSQDRGNLIYIFRSADIIDETLANPRYNQRELIEALKEHNIPDPKEIVGSFELNKWSFFPARLELRMEKTFINEFRLPFCGRRKVNEGGTAEVFQVAVPKAFVSKTLQGYFGKAFNLHEYGECYELAVKSYSESQYHVFYSEVGAFKGLSAQPGMVRYFGYYLHHDGQGRRTCNILLEFGRMDLSTYFIVEPPPEQTLEMSKFWASILEVAKSIQRFHQLTHLESRYYGWHGDVKPANILLVGQEFKLADFGFSEFKEGAKDTESQPETFMRGGTYTFGAPEFARAKSGKGNIRVSQKIDTWSFGCVLSVAVTWIVLGFKGVEEYEHLRQLAYRRRKSGAKIDAFHDGHDVLLEIKHWHNYLTQVMRMSDHFTSGLLKLIDTYLLKEETVRITSTELCEKMEYIISNPQRNTLPSGDDKIHASVTEALLVAKEFRNAIKSEEGIQEYYSHMQASSTNSWKKESRISNTSRYENILDSILANRNPEVPAMNTHSTTTDSTRETRISEANPPRDSISQPSLPTSSHPASSLPASSLPTSSLNNTISTSTHNSVQSVDTHSHPVRLHDEMAIWQVVKNKTDIAAGMCKAILLEDPEVGKRRDPDGYTPIMIAAKLNNIAIIHELLHYSNLPQRDMEGKTLLHHAVMGLHIKEETQDFRAMIEEVLEVSTNQGHRLVDILDNNYRSPLYYCVKQKHTLKTAAILVNNGAQINPPENSNGKDLLIEAVDAKNEAMVRLFLERADFNWAHLGESLDISGIPRNIKRLLEEKKKPPPKSRLWGKSR